MWGDVGRYREIWGARRAHREAHLVRAEVGEGSGEGGVRLRLGFKW